MPLTQLTSIVTPLDRANVDTDVIMPKQYLKSISRFGYGDWAFEPWRYASAGDIDTPKAERTPLAECVFNQPRFANSEILLSRENFGCGSSREHAVWGIRDMGYRVIIAPSFGDIFYNNCLNNGLLPIRLCTEHVEQLFLRSQGNTVLSVSVDVSSCQLSVEGMPAMTFELAPSQQQRLLIGQDSIAQTLDEADAIRAFETQHKQRFPWCFGLGAQ